MSLFYITQADIGTNIKVPCSEVTISGSKNNDSKPDTSSNALTEVQTQSFENPKYVLSGVQIRPESGFLTYAHILSLYTHKYISTNPCTLNITYDSNKTVSSLATGTAGIKVVLESFSIKFDTKDSRDAYIPTGTLTFRETK